MGPSTPDSPPPQGSTVSYHQAEKHRVKALDKNELLLRQRRSLQME